MAIATPQELLKGAYDQLGYAEGPLFEGASDPNNLSKKDWIEKGEWLTLTKEVEAEKIFFVENNPVVVFAQSEVNEPEALRKLFNKIWCMSRPRLLFLAVPGQLAVYDLANEPAKDEKDWGKIKPLEIAESANKVAKKLKAFRREQLETGSLFEEYRFGDIKNRADKALINNLKEVRRELIDKGLGGENIKYAHALIGRSIFIRYLEDRKILVPEDFSEIASGNKKWKECLENDAPRAGVNLSEEDSLYARVLSDKDFTFALFEKLAEDFNGDMFPDVEQEKEIITPTHLHLIQDLLFGDVGKQKKLFFYAYQFKIIPIELISSIYEEFYHPEVDKEKNEKSSEGAYYTPPALVEFLVNQVLTPARLNTKPRVVDPSCGSGIFLVEAFRRIVRHRRLELGKKPNFQNLQKILREQIAGIEINPEAARIAAFSLYLAMLHYLDPPSIREQIYERNNRLPHLVHHENKQQNDQQQKCYNILLAKNAFDSDYIENNPVLAKSFASNCADIVIGNPPWGSPSTRKEDKEARKDNKVAVAWCDKRELPIGDQERSQTFIWRTLDLLKPNGHAGLLVSTGVFLKYGKKSVKFREQWLANCKLESVFSFVHTRTLFFNQAISPFAQILFKKSSQKDHSVRYWASKKTKLIDNLHSIIFTKDDFKVLHSLENITDYKIWKIYLWGSSKDRQLIQHLETNKNLFSLSKKEFCGDGYTRGVVVDSKWLMKYKTLPHQYLDRYVKRYGKLNLKRVTLENPPKKVKTRGKEETYHGSRLIFKETIDQSSKPKGMVIVRLEDKPYSFTDSFFALKLVVSSREIYKCILGICWSSLARYYWFLTSSNWGVWRDKLLCGQVFDLPIKITQNRKLKDRIINVVEKLQSSVPLSNCNIFQNEKYQNELSKTEFTKLERELDQAIFELYELNDAEIDLVQDMCEITLPCYYSPYKSIAGKPVLTKRLSEPYGTIKSLPKNTDFSGYLKVFMQCWEAYLDKGTEFGWQVYRPEQTDSLIAAIFSVQKKGKKVNEHYTGDIKCWNDVLTQLENNLTQSFHSSHIYLEGMVRAVTDDFVMIIKRNEGRLWTRSMAREDAEATLVQAMNKKNKSEGNK